MRFLIIILIFSALLVAGCTTNANDVEIDSCETKGTCSLVTDESIVETKDLEMNIDKLEIYHFHATNQCVSCIAVGDLAEETVNTYFKEELDSGKIVFAHINADLPENKEIVLKYGATGSSLWLGTYDGEKFTPEQDVKVWYKINNKKAYMDYLKGEIERKLAGDYYG